MIPLLTMFIGISGSGKSTMINNYKGEEDIVVSSDLIREEFYGDESIQKDHNKIFQEVHRRIKDGLRAGYNVIFDATNLNRKKRVAFLQSLNKIKIRSRAIVVATLISECIKRDSARERTVGEDVIKRQSQHFQPPYYDEGWDEILISYNSKTYSLEDVLSFIYQTINMPQDNPHHQFSLNGHLARVGNNLKEMGESREMVIYGVLHDLGKLWTKTLDEDGVGHFYGHEYVSAYESLFFRNLEDDSDESYLLRAYVISLHMRHYSMSEKKYEKFLSELPKEVSKRLKALNAADKMG